MTRSVQSKMARGALWMVLFKFSERSLGLISTLILVRVLAPADFGVVAMALSFIAIAEMLAAFGFDVALIRQQDATVDHYHTAWTGNLLLGASITVIMLLAAGPVAEFYGRPEVFWVVCALAVGPLIGGAENIGVVAFRKDLNFRREFAFQLSRKIVGVLVAVPLAFLWQNYWALVAGILAAKTAGTAISYAVHPFRPHPTLCELRSLVRFSKWLLLNNVLGFLKERLSDFFIGRLHGPAALGLYNVSYEFANLPTTELSAPINRAVLPGFAKMTADPAALARAYTQTISVLALMAIPAAAGIYAVADYFVPVVLGAKWLAATPLLECLALNGAILFLHSSIAAVIIATGRPDRLVRVNASYVVTLGFAFVLFAEQGVTVIAYTVLGTSILITPLYLIEIRRTIGVGAGQFLRVVLRPLLAALIMVGVVRTFMPDYATSLPTVDAIVGLLTGVVIGVITYVTAILVMWLALKRPDGAERMVIDRIGRLLRQEQQAA